jgi:hypothetical protein
VTTLRPEAAEALRKRLARAKRRDDIEILRVLGVRPEWVQDWFGSAPGLVFQVEFTFTATRRRRRTDAVGFRLLAGARDDTDIRLPPALLQFLSDAVVTAEPGKADSPNKEDQRNAHI